MAYAAIHEIFHTSVHRDATVPAMCHKKREEAA